ncbi:hypothetical protein [Lentzea sp. CA-135723]|uniref:hypothetical protein n=1 Tax=Lentzea sp. CA-135723 TaxID=3239950 RepID=UPI003D94F031
MKASLVQEFEAVGLHAVPDRTPCRLVSDLAVGDAHALVPEGFVDSYRSIDNFRLSYQGDHRECLVPSHPVKVVAVPPPTTQAELNGRRLGEDVSASVELFVLAPMASVSSAREEGSNEDSDERYQCASRTRRSDLPWEGHTFPSVVWLMNSLRPASLRVDGPLGYCVSAGLSKSGCLEIVVVSVLTAVSP